ncbi:hypothetical protein CNMCM5793_003193 [Aspergillus hiratsukae]|uniref:Uncharacterized protein n=1 Tax=Aspergillus hiratsukae TaxID=1194566 RepID=A0A8H6PE77_9EURO|nr:hypothetical protein CNMCM5793_003193 [Aspergillus hiratsukae]
MRTSSFGRACRLLLFYAYQINGLNDPKDQTLGFKCKNWDNKAQNCVNDEWEACKGKGGGRCNFNELMATLGFSRTNDKLVGPPGADQNTATPDIEETAKRVCMHYTTPPNKKVKDFPPWKAMKGATDDFPDYTLKVGRVANDAWRHKTDENKHLWDGFDDTLDKVNIARAGDHGKFLISAAEDKLGKPNGMDIKRVKLGVNPLDGKPWETVDWKATADACKSKPIKDCDRLIRDFRNDWYTNEKTRDKRARDHYVLFKSYKRIGDQARSCRK